MMKTTSLRNLLSAGCALSLVAIFCSWSMAADAGVRIRFGLEDNEPKTWDGTVSVAPGRVVVVIGWRF
jgi:hypothetical protein